MAISVQKDQSMLKSEEEPTSGDVIGQTFSVRSNRHISDPALEDPFFRAQKDADTDSLVQQAPGCGERLVFQQNHKAVVIWSMILFMLLMYVGTVFVYRFAFWDFHLTPTGIQPLGGDDVAWKVVDHVVDAFFWFDLIFNFFLSYDDANGTEVVDMRRIAKRYLKGRFWPNLLACLPEVVIAEIIKLITEMHGDSMFRFGIARLYRVQRITRLARLSRLTRLIKIAAFRIRIPGWEWLKGFRGVRVTKFLLGLFFICHLLACGWYLIAALHHDVTVTWVGQRTVTVNGEERSLLNQGPFEQWLVSMYFILTVFTTVGFGDISANTEAEIMFVVLTMLVGAVVHSIVISWVIQVITTTDNTDQFIENQMQLVDAFALHTDLEPSLFKDIRADLKARSKQSVSTLGFDKEDMKTLLLSKYMPRTIIDRLPQGLYRGKLHKNLFFEYCLIRCPMPARLPGLMALHLHPVEFMAEEVVYQRQDFAFNLNLVLSGTFACVGRPSLQGGWDVVQLDAIEDCDASVKLGSRSLWQRLPSFPKDFLTSMRKSVSDTRRKQRRSPYRLFGAKNYFGDLECISGSVRLATVTCEQTGTVLSIRKSDLFELLGEFPQFSEVWASAAWRRERLRCNALKRLLVSRTCRDFAAATIQHAVRARKVPPDESQAVSTGTPAPFGMEPSPRDGAPVTQASNDSSAGFSQKHLKLMASPEKAQSHLLREVEQLRTGMEGMQAKLKVCRHDMAEVKETLQALLHKQGLDVVTAESTPTGTPALGPVTAAVAASGPCDDTDDDLAI